MINENLRRHYMGDCDASCLYCTAESNSKKESGKHLRRRTDKEDEHEKDNGRRPR